MLILVHAVTYLATEVLATAIRHRVQKCENILCLRQIKAGGGAYPVCIERRLRSLNLPSRSTSASNGIGRSMK